MRVDSPLSLIRIKESREYSLKGIRVNPINTIKRIKGSITQDNYLYKRYSGEIMITRKDFNKDKKVNVIGKINKDSLILLDKIDVNHNFKFIV